MELPAVFAYAYYTEPNPGVAAPPEEAPTQKRSREFDWFFATGFLMILGLVATAISLVA